MKNLIKEPVSKYHQQPCTDVPDFKRLNYFYGQMLGVHDFQTEQAYFLEKNKLHNRCLHGYGVVCGLLVEVEPTDDDCESSGQAQQQELNKKCKVITSKIEQIDEQLANTGKGAETKKLEALRKKYEIEYERYCYDSTAASDDSDDDDYHFNHALINCGMALDCNGNEIVVRYPIGVDVWRSLPREEQQHIKTHHSGKSDEGITLYLSVSFCEQTTDRTKPVAPDQCGINPECTYGKIRDSIRVHVSHNPPQQDDRCDSCCEPCADDRLLLAEIRNYRPDKALDADNIINSVRREIARYTPTTITGISWTHGGTYSAYKDGDAARILGTFDEGKDAGLDIHFSKAIRTDSLENGVIEIWVLEGGGTRNSRLYYREGRTYFDKGKEYVDCIRHKDLSDEPLSPGDRVMITIHTDFVLDRCCRSVDGNHVGGRVPILPKYHEFDQSERIKKCLIPPKGFGPWTSGNGNSSGTHFGGTFKSWFFVE